ncbi:MAG: tetratricopeptide repeat protein, partial [Rubrivivax sp.]|nr:tetratricopeptide repeat protein [Pyrinomonadaceae bacterium]
MGFDKVKTIRAAEKYLAQGKIPAAIQEYQRIVEFEADDFSALNTLGDLYARVEKKQEAVACYRRVAEHYREQGFTLKAIAMFKKLTRFSPEDHQIALALAALYEQQGLMVEARAQYLVAADAYARAGNTRQALEVLRRIADLDPSNTNIRLRLAESYARENLPDLAAEAYTHAGERLASRNEVEQSLDAFVKALALRPASHAALAGLLSAHTALGTSDEAAEVLEQAIKERPGDLEVRAMLARAYVEAEDAAHAERATQELVGRDPSSFALYFDVIRLHLRQGDGDGAVRLLGWVIEPAIAGRQETALTELLQEVLARNPEQMDAHRLLVRAYAALHDNARMRPALERLAEAAEATGDAEEEQRTLSRLV